MAARREPGHSAMRSVAVVLISTLALAVIAIVASGCSLRGRDDREAATDLRQAIAVAWEHHVARSGGEVAFPLRVGRRRCVVRHRLWRARTAMSYASPSHKHSVRGPVTHGPGNTASRMTT